MSDEFLDYLFNLKRNFISNLNTTEDDSLKQFVCGQLNTVKQIEDFFLQKNAEVEYQQTRAFTL